MPLLAHPIPGLSANGSRSFPHWRSGLFPSVAQAGRLCGPAWHRQNARAAIAVLTAFLLFILPAHAAPPPPADPRGLTTLTLDNALQLWVHPTPPPSPEINEVGLWLVIHSGVLAESNDQTGAAYLAKRAAGLGTPSVSGEALDRIGTRFGRPARAAPASSGAHALLSHEAVVYMLVVDAADTDAWSAALAHYADLLDGWSPDAAALTHARALAAERTGKLSPDEQARRRFLPEIFAGQPLGAHDLIPTPDRLDPTADARVRAFIRDHYRPSNATLIIAGPVDPSDAISRVRRTLERVPDAGPAPAPVPGIVRPVGGRVSAHAVPGYDPAEAALLTLTPRADAPAHDPATAAVLDSLAAELVGARVRQAAPLADAGVVSVDTAVKEWLDAARIAEISVRVEPPGLTRAGEGVAEELARIRRDGFTDAQLRAARAEVLARLERDAADWAAAGPQTVLEHLADAARLHGRGPGHGWISPTDRLSAAVRVLASTTNDAVLAHARAVFDPAAFACILISSDALAPPTPEEARRILAVAASARPAPRAEPPRSLLPDARPAEVVELSHDPAADTWTATLANGVVVRARRMTGAPTAVRVTLADGVARETAATLGRTRDATAAWRYPCTDAADAGQVRAWGLARGLSFRPAITDNMLTAEIDADAPGESGAADALALAAALIRAHRADHTYTDRVRPEQPDPGPAVRRLGQLLLDPADPRGLRPSVPERVDPAAADAWLAILAQAPIEAAVVGDLPPEIAIELAAATLGTLPARPSPTHPSAHAWSALPRHEVVERLNDPAASETALGIVFADARELDFVRPMMIAAAAVQAELASMADAGELGGPPHPPRPRAWVWLGDGIPDRVTLVVRCQDAADPDAARHAIDEAIQRVIDGRSDPAVLTAEIDRARKLVERAHAQPAFWADRLSRLNVHALGPDSLAAMPAAYASITPESVRAALAAAVERGVHKRVIVIKE